ncbi:hypothetical protein FOCG_18105 [Fusarium oxysporum f. sp. radicis-lycopersici 26381]|nr:hypothetical protein FOCG_18105 [Fusarium oxysporum f. sp. radicis-lycopersici 26381]
MLFTWDTANLCIVFRQWHIHFTASLVFSFLTVVLLGIGYEALRTMSRRYDAATSKHINALPSKPPYHPFPCVSPCVLRPWGCAELAKFLPRGDGAVTENTPFLTPGQNQAQAN